jgi:hypothetical protein
MAHTFHYFECNPRWQCCREAHALGEGHARGKKEAKQRAAAACIEAILKRDPNADFMKTARGETS